MTTQEEEEEALVLVELSGIIDNDFLYKNEKCCKILGVASDEPVLQIGHYIFSGEYKNALGTLAIFEETGVEKQINTGAGKKVYKELKLKHTTDKKLVMKRAFLKEKSAETTKRSTNTALETVSQGNEEHTGTAMEVV